MKVFNNERTGIFLDKQKKRFIFLYYSSSNTSFFYFYQVFPIYANLN